MPGRPGADVVRADAHERHLGAEETPGGGKEEERIRKTPGTQRKCRFEHAHAGHDDDVLLPDPGRGARDVDQLADEWRKAGMEVAGPADQEYGLREASHVDPDDNLIRFGSPSPN